MESILFLQQFASPALDQVATVITHLGSEYAYIGMLVITYLAISAEHGRRLGVYLLLSFYINFLLKIGFATPRPCNDPSVMRLANDCSDFGPAFPSGHAQASTTFWGLVAFYLKRPWFWPLVLLIIILIALSRIYLGVHYPVDVWGGVLIGLVVIGAALGIDQLFERLTINRWLGVALGILLPFVVHALSPAIPDTEVLLGGLAAFLSGPELFKHHTRMAWWRRVLTALIGLILAFGVLLGSSALLSEALKDNLVVGFVRYLLLGYAAILLTPWLCRRIGLVPQPHSTTA